MPKKGKVNKLARMSDEERAKYLQHRADIEEEARRRKRELIGRFIKTKLDKEETYSRMNTAKLNQSWRYILRNVKCDQLSSEIQGMRTSFNFLMERKERLLKTLLRAIDDADEQHRRGFQAHTEALSYFLSIGSDRLEKLQNEYDFQKNSLLENWDKEYFTLTGNQEKSEFKLQLITFIQANDFKNYKSQNELEHATAKNDARLEHEEEMLEMRRPKQSEIEYYWVRLKDVYNSYLEQHKPIIGHYHSLREKDDFYQRDIARNEIEIQQAMESLISLQTQWAKTAGMISYKINKKNAKKDELTRSYCQLKKSSKTNYANGVERLSSMVNTSQDVIKRLENVKEKLNKILQLSEICKKFEIEDKSLNSLNENNQLRSNVDDLINMDEYKDYPKLDKFLLKMSRVKVQTICLKAEKTKLLKENAQLKNYMKRYLTELALKNGRDHSRPISGLVQSDVKKLQSNSIKSNRPVTCIEGALSNAVLHEKRTKMFRKKNMEIGGIRAFPRTQCWMKAS